MNNAAYLKNFNIYILNKIILIKEINTKEKNFKFKLIKKHKIHNFYY